MNSHSFRDETNFVPKLFFVGPLEASSERFMGEPQPSSYTCIKPSSISSSYSVWRLCPIHYFLTLSLSQCMLLCLVIAAGFQLEIKYFPVPAFNFSDVMSVAKVIWHWIRWADKHKWWRG